MANIEDISNAFYNYSLKRYEEELNNSDQPFEKTFPSKSTFEENFKSNLSSIYNNLSKDYSPEQAKYIYETLVANLNKQSQNPSQSKIVNFSKGTINVENLREYSKKVEDFLKSRQPERFEENVKVENIAISDTKDIKFNELETLEEKKDWFNKNIADISKWEESDQNILIGIHTILYEKRIAKEQYVNDGYTEEMAEEMANKDVSKKYDINDNLIAHIEEAFAEDLDNLLTAETEEEKGKILENIQSKIKENYPDMDLNSTDLNEIIQNLASQDNENRKNKNIAYEESNTEYTSEDDELNIEDSLDMGDMFGEEEPEINEEMSNTENNLEKDMFGENEEISLKEENKIDNLQNVKNTYTNSIMAGIQIPREEFEQANYTQTINENPLQKFINGIRNRLFNKQKLLDEGQSDKIQNQRTNDELKQENYTQIVEEKQSIFSRIKNAILKSIHKNDIPAIDTAENNTPIFEDSKLTSTNTWELSQYGTSAEEIQKNTISALDNSKKNKSDTSIRTVSNQEINI